MKVQGLRVEGENHGPVVRNLVFGTDQIYLARVKQDGCLKLE